MEIFKTPIPSEVSDTVDAKGHKPRFVIYGGRMYDREAGRAIDLPDHKDETLRRAVRALLDA